MTDAVTQARNAVARACGALEVAAGNAGPTRYAHSLRELVAELETTGAWLRTLHAPEPDKITVVPGDGQPYPCDRWRATRRLPDGKTRMAWGSTPEAAVAQLCGRTMKGVR